jgi:hypothetical protein
VSSWYRRLNLDCVYSTNPSKFQGFSLQCWSLQNLYELKRTVHFFTSEPLMCLASAHLMIVLLANYKLVT